MPIQILLLLTLALPGCGIQRIPVRQLVTFFGEYNVGDNKVRRYRAYDPSRLDSAAEILRYEYLPFEFYLVSSPGDSLKFYIVAGWQEYLSRFAERLSSVDKQYYAPSFGGLKSEQDTTYAIWNYPSVEGRDRELKYSDKIRNEYWTIDLFDLNGKGLQRYESSMRSYPQVNPYRFRDRFSVGGSYERAMLDTQAITRRLRSELDRVIELRSAKSQ